MQDVPIMRIFSYQLSMSLNSQNFLKMYSRFLGNSTFVLCCNEQKKYFYFSNVYFTINIAKKSCSFFKIEY